MRSSSSDSDVEVDPLLTTEYWKNKGNNEYKSKSYPQSIISYTKAIQLIDDDTDNLSIKTSLLNNRAAAYLMLLQYKEAIADCDYTIKIDETVSKAYFRKATALKGLGQLEQAIQALNKGNIV